MSAVWRSSLETGQSDKPRGGGDDDAFCSRCAPSPRSVATGASGNGDDDDDGGDGGSSSRRASGRASKRAPAVCVFHRCERLWQQQAEATAAVKAAASSLSSAVARRRRRSERFGALAVAPDTQIQQC